MPCWRLPVFWLLIHGLFLARRGGLRSVLLLGLAALVAESMHSRVAANGKVPRRWMMGVAALLVLLHGSYFVARLTHAPRLSDIGTTTLAAAELAFKGENPYTARIDEAAIAKLGPDFGGYKYLPVMPLVYAPFGLMLGISGILVTNLLLDLATAALVMAAAQTEGGEASGLLAVAAYLSTPYILSELFAKGVTDLLPVALLLCSLIATDRHPALAGFLAGLSVSAKLLPALGALPAILPARHRALFIAGLAVGLLPTLAAYLGARQAFLDNILRFNGLRPTDSSSWMKGLSPLVTDLGLAGLALAWIVLAILALRYARRPAIRCGFVVLLLVAATLAGPGLRPNYTLWLIPFLAVALAGRNAAQPRPIPEQAQAFGNSAAPRIIDGGNDD